MSLGPIVVQKYGGSSVATAEKILAIAERVKTYLETHPHLVVAVSAMGKTTDQLVALARQVSRNPHGRDYDLLLASGEQVAVATLALALQDKGVPAIALTGAQCNIRTDGSFNRARIQSIDTARIEEELAKGKVVIVAGFQGVTENDEVTTLGRGGGDITGAAVAAALNASVCEICTDVDGVLSADPERRARCAVLAGAELRSSDRDGVERREGAAPARGRDLHVVQHSHPHPLELSSERGDVDSRRSQFDGRGRNRRRHERQEDCEGHAAERAGRAGHRGADLQGRGRQGHQHPADHPERGGRSSRRHHVHHRGRVRRRRAQAGRRVEAEGAREGRDRSRRAVATIAIIGSRLAATPGLSGRMFAALAQGRDQRRLHQLVGNDDVVRHRARSRSTAA